MMEKIFIVITTVLLIAILTESTEYHRCKNGKSSDTIETLSITNCERLPCKLKRRTEIAVEQKFVPEKDIHSLTTSVHATILSVPFPFIGVDGSDACNHIYDAEGKQIGCPLKGGAEYYYKNNFPIYDFYPKVSLEVYWALVEKGDTVTCFKVPSKITS